MAAQTSNFDVESPPHKALRLVMAAVSASLGQSSGLTLDLRRECLEALDLLDWHLSWSRSIVLPLVELLDPGVVAGLSQIYGQVGNQTEKIRRLAVPSDHGDNAKHSVPVERLYQHWSLLLASYYALMHREETVVQATLNHSASSDQIAALMAEFRERRPPELEPWLARALPVDDHATWLDWGENHD